MIKLCVLLLALPLIAMSNEIKAPYKFDWIALNESANLQEGDVSTYRYDVPDSEYQAFRGVTIIESNALSIVSVMMDLPSLKQWVYQLKQVKSAGQDSNNLYMSFHSLWPLTERDVAVRSYIRHEKETGAIHIYNESNDEYFPATEEFVRIPMLYNHWQLTPLSPGKVKVEFETLSDIGGHIPVWLMNMVSRDAPERSFSGLRKQLQTGKYNITSIHELPFIPEGLKDYQPINQDLQASGEL